MDRSGFKRRVKRAIFKGSTTALQAVGIPSLRRLLDRPGSLRVLMYHKINDERGNSVCVSVASFAQPQEHLARTCSVVSLEQILAHVEHGVPLPPRAVALTFDDGYRDNLQNAHPILKQYGHRATIFIPVDFQRERPPPPPRRPSPCARPVLSWDDVRALRDVFDIGAHAASHRVLTQMPVEEAREEILRSKAVLEAQLGEPVRAFAWPKGSIGDFNAAIADLVKAAGFRACFTTLPFTNGPDIDRFAIGRYNVEDYGLRYFQEQMEHPRVAARLSSAVGGFLPVPRRLRFIAKPTTPGGPSPGTARDWTFQLGDLDFF